MSNARNYYRGRTPLVVLLRRYFESMKAMRKVLRLVDWMNAHGLSATRALAPVDEPLARGLLARLEENPGLGYLEFELPTLCLRGGVDGFQALLKQFVHQTRSATKMNPGTHGIKGGSNFRAVVKSLRVAGLTVSLSSECEDKIMYIVALRDLVVHCDGIVDATFLKATNTNWQLGEKIRPTVQDVEAYLPVLCEAADAVQMALGADHFGSGQREFFPGSF